MQKYVLLLIFIIMTGPALNASPPQVEGTYLTGGVSGLLKIRKTEKGLYASECYGWGDYGKPVKIYLEKESLFIAFQKKAGKMVYCTAFRLTPSADTPGDWDLTGMSTGSFPMDLQSALDSVADLDEIYPSWLHRVQDDRIAQYCSKLSYHKPLTTFLPRIRDILSDHPTDPYIRLLFLDALLRNKEWEELEENLASWRADLGKNPNPSFPFDFRMIDRAILSHRLSEKGQNAADYLNTPLKPGQTFESKLEKAVSCGQNIPMPPLPTTKYQSIFNFMEMQVMVKVVCVDALFSMIKGDNNQALHLLDLCYRLHHLLLQEKTLISSLIAVAVKTITTNRMEISLLNACRTPEEIGAFHENLKELREIDAASRWDDFEELSLPLASRLGKMHRGNSLQDFKLRWMVGEAKSRLLSAAAAARYGLLKQGRFPQNQADFAPLEPNGPPPDPFSDIPLRFIPRKESLFIYSLGPDEKDNKAAFSYDPTNGILSPGDLMIEIPRNPRYPFPEKGRLATTKQGLSEQFPQGLPPDPFHDIRGAPLTIIDTEPARIISFGPDTDYSRTSQGRLLPLDPPYDPTNGIRSEGDLILNTGDP